MTLNGFPVFAVCHRKLGNQPMFCAHQHAPRKQVSLVGPGGFARVQKVPERDHNLHGTVHSNHAGSDPTCSRGWKNYRLDLCG